MEKGCIYEIFTSEQAIVKTYFTSNWNLGCLPENGDILVFIAASDVMTILVSSSFVCYVRVLSSICLFFNDLSCGGDGNVDV